ncbi:hypothetical protein [Streptomyces tsukubensis]|uniref:Uncharacterized protein n=1 Tax=Streptomyces tsukubensis TaxID=83656 RepID=A0A1V4A8D7_9ACTN|nr:hypothetical protein [Streptomyces tsukubensis]OON78032.1 hypothetical protein B1H18_17580 [Streptomyces tsukubensis]QFR97196.1 hypothetical protein GBW32_34235 [Streptomyces tsukubensis]
MDSKEQPASQVVVELSGSSEGDADAVFTALGGAFGSDRGAGDVPEEEPSKRPTVWTATFDVSDKRGKASPVHLEGSVSLSAQGGYAAVDQLKDALAPVFDVHVVGTSSGDQEQELQLRLENK